MKVLVLALFSFQALSSVGFDKYEGCYQTVKWNGEDVPVDAFATSTIKKGDSLIALNMDHSVIPAYEMLLFQGYSNNTYHYGYAFPFIDSSSYTTSGSKEIFSFKGEVRYRFQPEYSGNLEHRVEVETLANGNIWLHNYIQVDETTEFDTDETYELRPVSCN